MTEGADAGATAGDEAGAEGAGAETCDRDRGRSSECVGVCADWLGSRYRPKIILPAVVWSTLVTTMSMVLLIILRALSTTTIVPSSR